MAVNEKYHSHRFSCICGAQLMAVRDSKNRTGDARCRTYKCTRCGELTKTVEVKVEADLRGHASARQVLRREILETATAKELLDALKFHLLG